MRSIARRLVVSSLVLGTAGIWSGCTAKEQTEYVAGISTQVTVPRDIRAIRVAVSVGGFTQFCQAYRVVKDGKVNLPRSLGTFAQNDPTQSGPITYSIIGYAEEVPEDQEFALEGCQDVKVAGSTRILRRSRQPYILNEIKFLPMPLKYSCYDSKGCDGPEQTCKGGRCVTVDFGEDKAKGLPTFSEDLVDGTGSTCFPASECFPPLASPPPVVVDPSTCTYAIPNTPSAPPLIQGAPPNPLSSVGEGLNVEITYDGGLTREILDKDPDEGFIIPDPTKPQRFRLAPGLCDMVKGVWSEGVNAGKETEHRITAIRASGACQAKGPYQPLCANDANTQMGTPNGIPLTDPKKACVSRELKPAKSVLMILADDTKNHAIFYNGADRAAFDISLADPAFRKTDIGLTFFPGAGSCSGATPFAAAVAPKLAEIARNEIGAAFTTKSTDTNLKPLNTPVDLDGALRDTYALLKTPTYTAYNRRAVLVIGNRTFGTQTCGAGTPVAQATTAKNVDRINTYVVMLARQDNEDPNLPVGAPGGVPILVEADQLAQAGSTLPQIPAAFDARRPADKARGQDAFRRVVEDLATCAYDVEPGIQPPAADAVISFSDPIPGPPSLKSVFTVKNDPACNADGANANGWGADATNNRRIRLCGQACTDYREVLKKAAAYAAQYSQPSLAVPVFAHDKDCGPKE